VPKNYQGLSSPINLDAVDILQENEKSRHRMLVRGNISKFRKRKEHCPVEAGIKEKEEYENK